MSDKNPSLYGMNDVSDKNPPLDGMNVVSEKDPTHDRIRWHCRRGMLELDLVLNAFLERHLADLGPEKVDVFCALLECSDPELLDLVMGHKEPAGAEERELIALMRAA